MKSPHIHFLVLLLGKVEGRESQSLSDLLLCRYNIFSQGATHYTNETNGQKP